MIKFLSLIMSSGKNQMFINFFRNSFCHNPLSRYDRYIQFAHLLSKVGKSDISSTAFLGQYFLGFTSYPPVTYTVVGWRYLLGLYISAAAASHHMGPLSIFHPVRLTNCTFFVILCAINASKLCTQKTVILLLLEAQRARQDTEDVLGHPWQPNCCFIHLDKY